jgi:ribosome maturation factor RimP
MEFSLEQLTDEVRRRVADLGFELVDLRSTGSKARTRLQVRVDRVDVAPEHGITVDECASVSRALEAWLDESQVFGSRYALEVSSPGIERPVRWREHWERFRGHDVNVRVTGRGRFRATIVAVEGNSVVIRPEHEQEDVEIPLDAIRDATLVVDWSAIGRRDRES